MRIGAGVLFFVVWIIAGCTSRYPSLTALSPRPRHISAVAGDWVCLYSEQHEHANYRLRLNEFGAGTLVDRLGSQCAFSRAKMLPEGYQLIIDNGQSNSLRIISAIAIPYATSIRLTIKADTYEGKLMFRPIKRVRRDLSDLENL